MAAEIVTAKYGYHLPIYRQQDYFAGSGWTPSRSTLLNILVARTRLLRGFVLYLRDASALPAASWARTRRGPR